MSASADRAVTEILRQWNRGGAADEAASTLLPLVYAELRRRAAMYLRRERHGHTLQPTALVHEAYLRLADQRHVQWQNRGHFFGVAAQAMRRILVDHARTRQRLKRGGDADRVTLHDVDAVADTRDVELIDLDRALTELQSQDPDQARIVEMRYFAGLTVEETAEALGISPATVKREWTMARAWLFARLRDRPGSTASERP
jgi:RNA polymerase sigma-70 factor, ECF subfamily